VEKRYKDILRPLVAELRRTLAGALVTLGPDRLTIERAPPRRAGTRRTAAMRKNRKGRFTN